jgi:hypothetical protein
MKFFPAMMLGLSIASALFVIVAGIRAVNKPEDDDE